MAKFKVGDRVRIIGPEWSQHIGKTGTIWRRQDGNWGNYSTSRGVPADALGFTVDIDGIGKFHPSGNYFAYEVHNLAPLVPPHEEAWQAFKRLHLTPDPALIVAKEKELVTLDKTTMKWWLT